MHREISFISKPSGYVEVNYVEHDEVDNIITNRTVNYHKDRLDIYLDNTSETFAIVNGALAGVFFAKNDVLAPVGSSYSTSKQCFDAIMEVIKTEGDVQTVNANITGGAITAGSRTLNRFFKQVTNAVEVISLAPCKIYRIEIINPPMVIGVREFVKAFDTIGSVTVGSTVPNKIWSVEANGYFSANYGDNPIIFSNGLKICAVTDSDNSSSSSPTEALWVDIAWDTA